MEDFWAFVIFTTTATLTPGPNNFMIMNSGMNFGIKKSLPHYFGISLGYPVMLLIVAMGFGVIFTKYLWIKALLKVIGSIYMLYLAWKILTSHSKSGSVTVGKPLTFLQAMLFQWVNPKAWLMAVSVISIFTINENYFINALYVSGISFLICIPGTGVWLYFGKILQKILQKDQHRIWFNMLMALGLVASIAMLYFD